MRGDGSVSGESAAAKGGSLTSLRDMIDVEREEVALVEEIFNWQGGLPLHRLPSLPIF